MRAFVSRDRGVALVEFALVAPVLLLVLLGIVGFGLLVDARSVMSAASREGAHFLALHPNRSSCDVQTEVRRRVAPFDESTVNVSVGYYAPDSTTRSPAAACPNGVLPAAGATVQTYQVEVTVSYQLPSVFAIPFVSGSPNGSALNISYTARADVGH